MQICAGDDFTLIRTDRGLLLAVGGNGDGQLDLSDLRPRSTPALVTLPHADGTVADMWAGARSGLAITTAHEVYTWGDSSLGQTGHGVLQRPGATAQPSPRKIDTLTRNPPQQRQRRDSPHDPDRRLTGIATLIAHAERKVAMTSHTTPTPTGQTKLGDDSGLYSDPFALQAGQQRAVHRLFPHRRHHSPRRRPGDPVRQPDERQRGRGDRVHPANRGQPGIGESPSA